MAEAQPITLDIEGMTCANCAMGVRKSLQQQGFENVSVNFAAGEATFRKPPALQLDRAINAVRGLGFEASLHRGEREETAGLSAIERKFLAALVFTLPLFLHMFVAHDHFLNRPMVQLLLCLPVMALGVAHFGRSAFYALRSGVPNMDVLIFTGSSAAFIYSLAGTWRYA
ncbi:MAG: cation transporter, partial [Bacteroidota bacterium]